MSKSEILKQQILNFLKGMEEASPIHMFWDFLIQLKTQQNISKQQLYDILMKMITEDLEDESFSYDMVTDSLDYFVHWHSPLTPEHFAYEFVQQLNSQ